MSDFFEVLRSLCADWKAKQNKNSYECAVILERGMATQTAKSTDWLISKLDKAKKVLQDTEKAFSNECILPHDNPKARSLRAIQELIKELS